MFAYGLNFVVIAVWVPVAITHSGGMAMPIGFRLYRSKKTCPIKRYRKRTELAVELLHRARQWFGDRPLIVVADAEYACQTVLRNLPRNTGMVGPLPMDARLCDPHVEPTRGKGRRRKWGQPLAKPHTFATDSTTPWKRFSAKLYGRNVRLQVKSLRAVWRCGGADQIMQVVVSRDPKKRWPDAAYFGFGEGIATAIDVLPDESQFAVYRASALGGPWTKVTGAAST